MDAGDMAASSKQLAELHLQLKQRDDRLLVMKNKTKEFVENLKNDHNEVMNIQRKQKEEIVQVQTTIVVFVAD